MLILSDKIPSSIDKEAFTERVKVIASALDTDPNWIMMVMYFESKLYPSARNPYGSATGLIQFTAKTARSLGTTTAQLAVMDGVKQLDYVYAYLKPYKRHLTSLVNVYLSVFQPAAVNKPMDYVFKLSHKWVEANRIFDLDRNGKIVKHEVADYLTKYFKPFMTAL